MKNIQIKLISSVFCVLSLIIYVIFIRSHNDKTIHVDSNDEDINEAFGSLLFRGQFGYEEQISGIPANASLDDLWHNIEINRISIWSKSLSLSRVYNYGRSSRLSVMHDSKGSVYPEFLNGWWTLYGLFDNWYIIVDSLHNNHTKTKVWEANKMIGYFDIGSLTSDYNYDYNETVIWIEEILSNNNDDTQLNKLYDCLSTNGWCFVKYPEKDNDIIQAILNRVHLFLLDDTNSSSYNKYYYEYSYYKKMIHIFTGDIFDLYQYKYPMALLDDLRVLSNIVDTLSINIMERMYNKIFKLNMLSEFIRYNITILNNYPANVHGLQYSAGMLDFVLYYNEGNDILEQNPLNVREHTDPGLFTLSFGSDNLGLQMFDIKESKWINVPNNYGVLWCGEIASKITNKNIKSGIHRVVENTHNKHPRFTAWFEVCINEQVWPSTRAWLD